MDQNQIDRLETEESMFVQTARGITSDGATLTLGDVTPATPFFSDRPQRVDTGGLLQRSFPRFLFLNHIPLTSLSTRNTGEKHGKA
jgi:hypothetical protein